MSKDLYENISKVRENIFSIRTNTRTAAFIEKFKEQLLTLPIVFLTEKCLFTEDSSLTQRCCVVARRDSMFGKNTSTPQNRFPHPD